MKRRALRLGLLFGWTAALPVRAGIRSWTSAGPFGGPIEQVALVPSNPATVFAVTFNGGVFRSVDSGAHWSQTIDGLGNLTVNAVDALAVLADDARGRVFAGIDGSSVQELDLGTRGPVIPAAAPQPKKTKRPIP